MRIGVISDTHGHLDQRVKDLFAGVDHILHAGDIGSSWIILELGQIAPVTAVLGNNDSGLPFKETELVQLNADRFLVHHIFDVRSPATPMQRRIIQEKPRAVVFGHTHKPYSATIGTTLYFNPGYAGQPRFGLERSVAILTCEAERITSEFMTL